MGMDVYGVDPVSERGKYFRNNVWWWHPLWEYCEEVYKPCRNVDGHTNGGDGLDNKHALELAGVLFEKLAKGEVAAYGAARQMILDCMPDEICDLCDGTGQRPDGLYGLEWKKDGCNGCESKGTKRPFSTWYSFDEDNVREFAQFCAESGGFEIC